MSWTEPWGGDKSSCLGRCSCGPMWSSRALWISTGHPSTHLCLAKGGLQGYPGNQAPFKTCFVQSMPMLDVDESLSALQVLRSLVVDFSWEETAGEAVLVLSTPVLLKAGLVLSHATLLQDSSFETVLLSWGLSCCSGEWVWDSSILSWPSAHHSMRCGHPSGGHFLTTRN